MLRSEEKSTQERFDTKCNRHSDQQRLQKMRPFEMRLEQGRCFSSRMIVLVELLVGAVEIASVGKRAPSNAPSGVLQEPFLSFQ